MTDSLLHILAKDFDDIMPAEMQALRNKYREDLGFLGVIPPDKIFNYYLLQKSAKISPLETVLVQPRTFTSSGVFGGRAASHPKTVYAWIGMDTKNQHPFVCSGPMTLPLLTVHYGVSYDEIVCIAPNGGFCRLRSTDFIFDV